MNVVDDAIDYVIKFKGMKYVLAHDTDIGLKDGPPFWNTNTIPPDINTIIKNYVT